VSDKYQSVGYSSSRIEPGVRPAVLLVDFQTAFTDPKYPLGDLPMVDRACEKTAELLEVAMGLGVPVASCYTAYHSEADMPLWKVEPVRKDFYYGHPCTAIDPRVDHPDYIFTFCKNAPSIFFNTPVTTFLTRQNVDTVIVTGCTTSGCVRASVVDAFSHGYRILVPEDCVGDVDEGPHRDSLRDIGRRYCEVVTAADAMQYLRKVPEAA
jgi:maleamate amidohydrolase